MNRRNFIQKSALTIGAFTLLPNGLWAKSVIDTPYKIKEVRRGVSVFTEKGGTIAYLNSPQGMVVVDSQFPEQSQHLIDELKKRSQLPFELLINTHHHGDHTAGNISFKGLVKNVLAHENSKANQERVAKEKKTEEQQLYPDKTYATTWSQAFGKEEITMHYFGAGHTNGDSFVHFKKANIVHTGDLVFNRRHPFVDRTAGANIKSWIQVLDKAEKTFNDKTIFVCGHAAEGYDIVVNKKDISAFKDYLSKVLAFTAAQIKEGKTKEEIIKATEIPGATEWKGDGIDRPLTAAFDELVKG